MKHLIALLLLAAGVAPAACGQSTQGQSTQDKAKTQVCDARADIQQQVNELSGLTLATATVDGVTANLQAIKDDLSKIKNAQGDLNGDRKKQVQAANQAFEQQVTSTVENVGKSLSITQAATRIQAAVGQLADSYEQTLGQINCG